MKFFNEDSQIADADRATTSVGPGSRENPFYNNEITTNSNIANGTVEGTDINSNFINSSLMNIIISGLIPIGLRNVAQPTRLTYTGFQFGTPQNIIVIEYDGYNMNVGDTTSGFWFTQGNNGDLNYAKNQIIQFTNLYSYVTYTNGDYWISTGLPTTMYADGNSRIGFKISKAIPSITTSETNL